MTGNVLVVAVIPVYNEERTIVEIVQQVQKYVDRVIVVDDGSTDKTEEVLSDLKIDLLRNNENLGKGLSLQRGFKKALLYSPNHVITLDGDGQHRPEEIPRLLKIAQRYPDVIIIGARNKNALRAPKIRRFANRFADFWVSWSAGYPIRDSQSGFRVYPPTLLKKIIMPQRKGRGFVFESEVLIAASILGTYSCGVDIDTIYLNDARQSHYQPCLDTLYITLMIAQRLLFMGMNIPGLLRVLRVLPDPRKNIICQ